MPSEPQYIPTNWQTGQKVSSVGLNKIEDRIVSMRDCIMYTRINGNGRLDKTWKEIADAIAINGKVVIIKRDDVNYFVTSCIVDYQDYGCVVTATNDFSNYEKFATDSLDGYPVFRPSAM